MKNLAFLATILISTSGFAANKYASFNAIVGECVVAGIDAAAKDAFNDNNLQHLYGFKVKEGDLATSGRLSLEVTTGNDEDGDSSRLVTVEQKIDRKTGKVTCKVLEVSLEK